MCESALRRQLQCNKDVDSSKPAYNSTEPTQSKDFLVSSVVHGDRHAHGRVRNDVAIGIIAHRDTYGLPQLQFITRSMREWFVQALSIRG